MASVFSNKRVLYYDGKDELSYLKGRLYFKRDTSKFKSVKIGDIKCKSIAISRLMRLEPRCSAKVNDNCFLISWNGCILNYCPATNSYNVEHVYDRGMKNPLSFLSLENVETGENDVFYGEYIWNGNKGPVGIYKRSKGKWEKIYEFSAGLITHIHNIIYDSYRKQFIILTGDSDNDSGIWVADLSFSSVEALLIGSQQYRACVAFPAEEGIFFATDTPLEDNYIYYLPIDKKQPIGKPEKKFVMPGPCIYGTMLQGKMIFATSVEPNSELPTWKYRMTYQLGRGVHSRRSSIIVGKQNGTFNVLTSFEKDKMPIWLFQFGNIVFPENKSNLLLGVLQSLKPKHGVTVRIEV